MAFLNLLYDIPRTVRNFLSPNNKKRSRDAATENIEVESLPNSKRQATTTRFEEPKQHPLPLQSHHSLLAANRINTAAATPIRLPKTTFTWGKFAPHSVHRSWHNNHRGDTMPKKSIAPPISRAQVEEDAKGLELYKAGVEAHRILEAQRYQRVSELPSKAFSKPNQAAAAGGGSAPPTAVDGARNDQPAGAAQKIQQADKFRDILSQFTNELRSTYTSREAPLLTVPDNRYYGADGASAASKEAGVQLATEKYSQRLTALKSRMDMALKAVEDSKMSLQKEKKTEQELKEVRPSTKFLSSSVHFYCSFDV